MELRESFSNKDRQGSASSPEAAMEVSQSALPGGDSSDEEASDSEED
jgi:hypothetical protein